MATKRGWCVGVVAKSKDEAEGIAYEIEQSAKLHKMDSECTCTIIDLEPPAQGERAVLKDTKHLVQIKIVQNMNHEVSAQEMLVNVLGNYEHLKMEIWRDIMVSNEYWAVDAKWVHGLPYRFRPSNSFFLKGEVV